MTDHSHRARRLLARGTLSVAVVLALSGALFAANAKFARAADDQRHPQDLAELATVRTDRVRQLAAEVDDLRADVESLADETNADLDGEIGTPSLGYLVEGGSTPVVGRGLTIRLDDAPVDSPLRGTSIDPDVLVVHQQDVQAVVNALWAGGAEAMGLMDQRVISTSAFRCVGNVLHLHSRSYSPPFVIHAIGDPEELRDALDDSTAVAGYVRDAKDVGLGWSVETVDTLELPAYSGATELDEARVPEGVEILPGLEEALRDARRDAAASQSRKLQAPSAPTGAGGADD